MIPVGSASSAVTSAASADAHAGQKYSRTTTAGAWELPSTATGLNYSLVSDANLIWLYALNAGDAVEYSIQ